MSMVIQCVCDGRSGNPFFLDILGQLVVKTARILLTTCISCTSSDRLGWGAGFKLVAVIDWLLNLGSTIVLMLPGFSKMVWKIRQAIQTRRQWSLDLSHRARSKICFRIHNKMFWHLSYFDGKRPGFSFILPFFMLTKLSVSNCSKRSSNASRTGPRRWCFGSRDSLWRVIRTSDLTWQSKAGYQDWYHGGAPCIYYFICLFMLLFIWYCNMYLYIFICCPKKNNWNVWPRCTYSCCILNFPFRQKKSCKCAVKYFSL